MNQVHKIKKILLVDDEKGVVQALSLLLKAIGYTAFPFHVPTEALDFLEQEMAPAETPGIDLVLSDLRMPGLDGIEVLTLIKQKYPNLPFVLMSGHATDEDQRKAITLGADGFLPKPFSPDALNQLLMKIELSVAV